MAGPLGSGSPPRPEVLQYISRGRGYDHRSWLACPIPGSRDSGIFHRRGTYEFRFNLDKYTSRVCLSRDTGARVQHRLSWLLYVGALRLRSGGLDGRSLRISISVYHRWRCHQCDGNTGVVVSCDPRSQLSQTCRTFSATKVFLTIVSAVIDGFMGWRNIFNVHSKSKETALKW